MKLKLTIGAALCGSFLALVASTTNAQLFSETFDDGQATNRWTAYPGCGVNATFTCSPLDTNFDREPFLPSVDGVNDDFSGFSFDYSSVGIPSAPNSTGGTTVGLKMQANLFTSLFGGFSASPNGLVLPSNFKMTFDSWANSVGPFPGGGAGSTVMNTAGILNTGTQSETIIDATGVFFGWTGDGGSSADYRAYSVEDENSYDGTAGEPHATYAAGSRNSSAQLYKDVFGIGTTVPASQVSLFPGQTGTLNDGAAGFKWTQNEIKKDGNTVTWSVNGTLLITVDLTNFTTPTLGNSISFGAADIANSTPGAEGSDLLFALFDNILVEELDTAAENADFDGDDDVDGRDFLSWQRGFGINDGTALPIDGDATGEGNVDGDDLIVWQTQYGEPVPPLSAVTSVPEPASVTLFGALLAFLGLRRPAFGFAYSR
jgi:hypothetical protein